MRWAGQLLCLRYKIHTTLKEEDNLTNVAVFGKIHIKYDRQTENMRGYAMKCWGRIERCCEHGNESLDLIKMGSFLTSSANVSFSSACRIWRENVII
jgi:hypothetical protein